MPVLDGGGHLRVMVGSPEGHSLITQQTHKMLDMYH